ncbi:MAG: sensor histidine kinase [Lachnospiraceae bacterium]|jgi:sensor histidine kinase YesM|nr:sensor histidine kinase [Lachnospiraceae bacterium]
MWWGSMKLRLAVMGAAEAALFFLFMKKQKCERGKGWLWGGALLLSAVYIPLQMIILHSLSDLTLRLLAGVLLTRFLYSLAWRRSCFLCLLFYLTIGVSKSLLSRPILLGFGFDLAVYVDGSKWRQWGLSLATMVLEAFVVWVCARNVFVEKEEDTPALQLMSALSSCATYIITRQVLRSYSADNMSLGGWEITAAMFALCIATLLIALFSEYYFISVRRRTQIQKLEQLLHMQYVNFEHQQEADEAVRQMYHDIRNHLNCIRNMSPGREVESYVENICREISEHERFFRTGNHVLDIILREKTLLAGRKGISLQVYTDFETMDFMEAMDICAVFANALDNAIEATQKVQEQAERMIRIKIRTMSRCLAVKIVNPCVTKLHRENGRLLTSKPDRENHGLGLASLEHSLNKYEGEWEIREEGGIFTLTILIPVPEKASERSY